MIQATIGGLMMSFAALALFGAYRMLGAGGIDTSTLVGSAVAVVTTASLVLVARN
jgi:hypothetical protein